MPVTLPPQTRFADRLAAALRPGPVSAAPVLPLEGITVLAVEDSRFASEALRLLCQRSGARLRRAETLLAARAHLRVYRPDVVIVDLGLPDGRGEDLIDELARAGPGGPAVLGSSGDPAGGDVARAAGAAGYLEKPLESLAGFQRALLRHLPERAAAPSTGTAESRLCPDLLALQDDLCRAADLARSGGPGTADYVTGFVSGLARSSHDPALGLAAEAARRDPARMDRLLHLMRQRRETAAQPFGPAISPPC